MQDVHIWEVGIIAQWQPHCRGSPECTKTKLHTLLTKLICRKDDNRGRQRPETHGGVEESPDGSQSRVRWRRSTQGMALFSVTCQCLTCHVLVHGFVIYIACEPWCASSNSTFTSDASHVSMARHAELRCGKVESANSVSEWHLCVTHIEQKSGEVITPPLRQESTTSILTDVKLTWTYIEKRLSLKAFQPFAVHLLRD